MAKPNIQTLLIPDDGVFPNNDALPLVLMQHIFDPTTENLVQTIEKTFHGMGRYWKYGRIPPRTEPNE
jgi:hypothetical protein